MNPVNIVYRNDYDTANYRLRNEPVRLNAKAMVGCVPSGDGWEVVWDESVMEERYRAIVRSNPGRKQRAAKYVVPTASIKLVPIHLRPEAKPQPVKLVSAIFEDKPKDELTVAQLEVRVAELLGELKSYTKMAK